MFISQLYEGAISDKYIVERSGFLEILRQKVTSGGIEKGESIMADKGFDIPNDLKKLDLKLNIPPYCLPDLELVRIGANNLHSSLACLRGSS